MTVTDVEQARAALVAHGLTPSQRAILRLIGKGSKRDVVKFLRQLEYVRDPCNFSLQHLMCLSQRGVSGLTAPAASPYPARIAQTV